MGPKGTSNDPVDVLVEWLGPSGERGVGVGGLLTLPQAARMTANIISCLYSHDGWPAIPFACLRPIPPATDGR